MKRHLHYFGLAYLMIIVIIAALIYQVPVMFKEKPQIYEPVIYYTTNTMLNGINEIRVNNGKTPLEQSEGLNESAAIKAKELIDRKYWSHDTPDSKSFSRVIFDHNPKAIAVGENLAKCYSTDEEALKAWVASPSHYENILGNWKYWGLGTAQTSDCKYIVNHFSR